MKLTLSATVTAIERTSTSDYSGGMFGVHMYAQRDDSHQHCSSILVPLFNVEQTRELGALIGKPGAVWITFSTIKEADEYALNRIALSEIDCTLDTLYAPVEIREGDITRPLTRTERIRLLVSNVEDEVAYAACVVKDCTNVHSIYCDAHALLPQKARLDADGTAKPLTRLIHHPPSGACVGPGMPLHNPELETQSGERIPLTHDSKICDICGRPSTDTDVIDDDGPCACGVCRKLVTSVLNVFNYTEPSGHKREFRDAWQAFIKRPR